eukprot:gnl/MRDRNA2_/MRDRNA2_35920_c0_seq2.p1 gnl/MRDRNA2_/MRDRNA2_35920_c0~~gnl/MRDRNA2_/MRDRNA2_35920_c0_seq2.p1  ORF type:complete len:459 (+),score=113.75 gnl/MRDRNA2_/MRDRNA2_35920_c0_seq2:120-1496(+)
MSDLVVVAEPLLQEVIPRGRGKAFALLSLLSGLGLVLFYSSVVGQRQSIDQPGFVMAWKPTQMARSWQSMQPARIWQSRASTPSGSVLSGFLHTRLGNAKKLFVPRAQGREGAVADGPAKMHSGQAQMALNLLKENPSLFDERVVQQLETLRDERKEEQQQQFMGKTSAQEPDILRSRINEVRRKERIRIVTELLYLKVLNKFNQLKMPLIPSLKSGGNVRFGGVNMTGLTMEVHSEDAKGLVQEHLFRMINTHLDTSTDAVDMILFEASQVYAMSCLFGYWLRNADQRFQLEKLADQRYQLEKLMGNSGVQSKSSLLGGNLSSIGSKYLKDYISSFEAENFRDLKNAMEARKAIELQVTALFGDLKVLRDEYTSVLRMVTSREEKELRLKQAVADNVLDSLHINSEELVRLVLEAVAFGSLLSEAKQEVNTIYALTPSQPFQADPFPGPSDDQKPPQ